MQPPSRFRMRGHVGRFVRGGSLLPFLFLSACSSNNDADDVGGSESELSGDAIAHGNVRGRWELLDRGSALEALHLRQGGRFTGRAFLDYGPITFEGNYELKAGGRLVLSGPALQGDVGYGEYEMRAVDGDLQLRRLLPQTSNIAFRYGRGVSCPVGTRNLRGYAYDGWLRGDGSIVPNPYTPERFKEEGTRVSDASGKTIDGTVDARGRVRFACVADGPYTYSTSSFAWKSSGGSALFRVGREQTTAFANDPIPPNWKIGPTGPDGNGVEIKLRGTLDDYNYYLSLSGWYSWPAGPSREVDILGGFVFDPTFPVADAYAAQYVDKTLPGATAQHAVRGGGFESVNLLKPTQKELTFTSDNKKTMHLDWDILTQARAMAHGRPLVTTASNPTRGELRYFSTTTSTWDVGNWVPHAFVYPDFTQDLSFDLEYVDPAGPTWKPTYDTNTVVSVRLSNGHTGLMQGWQGATPVDAGMLRPSAMKQVRNLSVAGRLANRPLLNVGHTPVIRWDPPEGTTPSFYWVVVTPFDDQQSGAEFITEGTSVQLADGDLPGASYIAIYAIGCPDGTRRACSDLWRMDEITDVVSPDGSTGKDLPQRAYTNSAPRKHRARGLGALGVEGPRQRASQ